MSAHSRWEDIKDRAGVNATPARRAAYDAADPTIAEVTEPEVPEARELTRDESRAMFDEEARRLLGMSGPEFIRAWDAGELDADDDRVLHLWMLLPFGR